LKTERLRILSRCPVFLFGDENRRYSARTRLRPLIEGGRWTTMLGLLTCCPDPTYGSPVPDGVIHIAQDVKILFGAYRRGLDAAFGESDRD
jgi:hypothetical protein